MVFAWSRGIDPAQSQHYSSLFQSKLWRNWSLSVQVLKTDKDKEEAKHEEEIADFLEKHSKELQDLESANNQKLMSEYEKYQELQAKSQKMQEDYERQLTEMEESKDQALEELTEYYENKLTEKSAQLEQVIKWQTVCCFLGSSPLVRTGQPNRPIRKGNVSVPPNWELALAKLHDELALEGCMTSLIKSNSHNSAKPTLHVNELADLTGKFWPTLSTHTKFKIATGTIEMKLKLNARLLTVLPCARGREKKN